MKGMHFLVVNSYSTGRRVDAQGVIADYEDGYALCQFIQPGPTHTRLLPREQLAKLVLFGSEGELLAWGSAHHPEQFPTPNAPVNPPVAPAGDAGDALGAGSLREPENELPPKRGKVGKNLCTLEDE